MTQVITGARGFADTSVSITLTVGNQAPGQLPRTGAGDQSTMLLSGTLLVMAGALLAFLGRRRERGQRG